MNISDDGTVDVPFDEPKGNPYHTDSFGLPPGTIRGTLALTALVLFLLIEGVNLYTPTDLEQQFDGLITALQMVLAFYFGSKAVDVLNARTKKKAEEIQEAPPPVPPPITSPGPPEPAETGTQKEETPTVEPSLSDLPAMKSSASDHRLANIVAVSNITSVVSEGGAPTTPKVLSAASPLAQRVLAMTASFETSLPFPDCFGATTGNFDGQGMSYGALQWNFQQGTLQPIFRAMRDTYPDDYKTALGTLQQELSAILDASKEEQLQWVKNIQFTRVVNNRTIWYLSESWKNALRQLGLTPGMIELQVRSARARFEIALQNCQHYELTTERGAALMFDINVQNGRVDVGGAGDKISQDFGTIDPKLPADAIQVARMRIIANRRADVAASAWREDVRKRKLTIAEGKGTIHGKEYDLGKDFVLRLSAMAAPPKVNAPTTVLQQA